MLRKSILTVMSTLTLLGQDVTSTPKPSPITTPARPTATGRALLDHDLLDPGYFGIDGALMKETKIADFLWVKPGFSFKGHTLKVVWETPHLLVPQVKKIDLEVADRLTKILPQEFSKAMATSLWPAAKVSSTEGDLILTGRIVMINTRSPFTFTKDTLTFDLKVLDAVTREVVLACHHRFIPYGSQGGQGKNLELRSSAYAFEFSEYCSANYTR